MAALNREEQAIVYAFENGTLLEIAENKARINSQGFTHNWTVEQHLERLEKKAAELIASQTPKIEATNNNKWSNLPKTPNFNRLGGDNPDKALAALGFGE